MTKIGQRRSVIEVKISASLKSKDNYLDSLQIKPILSILQKQKVPNHHMNCLFLAFF